MSARLIDEPPLLVLPSLAREIGLTDAILIQQIHFAGQRTDGWVERSAADWHRALRKVISARTIERIIEKHRGTWLEVEGDPGRPLRVRVRSDKLSEVGSDTLSEVAPTSCRSPLSRERTTERGKKILTSAEEPIGFSEWLAYHAEKSGRSVPRERTKVRATLARMFEKLAGEGASAEDFRLATDGVMGNDWMVGQGHTKFLTVLWADKFWDKVDDGRAAREVRDAGSKYAAYDGEEA
jgi:hypothetical protein